MAWAGLADFCVTIRGDGYRPGDSSFEVTFLEFLARSAATASTADDNRVSDPHWVMPAGYRYWSPSRTLAAASTRLRVVVARQPEKSRPASLGCHFADICAPMLSTCRQARSPWRRVDAVLGGRAGAPNDLRARHCGPFGPELGPSLRVRISDARIHADRGHIDSK